MRNRHVILSLLALIFSTLGCGILVQNPPGAATEEVAVPTATRDLPLPEITTPTASEIVQPTDSPTTEPPSPPPTSPPVVTEVSVTPYPSDIPALSGSFDVYIGEPAGDGTQLLRWVSTDTGLRVTELNVKTNNGKAYRGGEYIYWVDEHNQPFRANTAGSVEALDFAAPPGGTTSVQFIASPSGGFVAWLTLAQDGIAYSIYAASSDGNSVSRVAAGQLDVGTQIELVRLTNNGNQLFYDVRPLEPAVTTVFNPRYLLNAINLNTREVTTVVGEPACGESAVCDAYVSLDGTFLARTLPADVAAASVVVTNLVTKQAVGRFEPLGVPRFAAFQVGYPFFSPGGQLTYVVAYGPPGIESYHLVLANLVTGEQTLIAEYGPDRHRPLGWSADGRWLLTTREPALFDTWQTNVETGELRRIAGMLYVGHIEIP